MRRRPEIISIIMVALFSMFFIPAAEAQSANNYIPEIKLMVSTDDGATWSENLKNLNMGQPFYLMAQLHVRVPGKRLQWFGAKNILCSIAFPEDQIIDIGLQDSDTAYNLSELIFEKTGNSKSTKFTLNPHESIDAGHALIMPSDYLNYLHDNKIENFLLSSGYSKYSLFTLSIPTSPVNDNDLARGVKPRIVTVIFRVNPLKSGAQTIKVFYERRVDSTYMKTYTLVVN